MFAPWIRHIVPEVSGWKKFKTSANKLIEFYSQTVEEHKETYSEEHLRYLNTKAVVLVR
jgi:hypothetical protein